MKTRLFINVRPKSLSKNGDVRGLPISHVGALLVANFDWLREGEHPAQLTGTAIVKLKNYGTILVASFKLS